MSNEDKTTVTSTGSTDVFDRQIQEEADRERETILSRAESHAREITRKAEKDIEEYRKSVMDRVQAQAETKLRHLQSQARIELSRRKLELQEKVFERIFESALSEIAKSMGPDLLASLLAEAILAIQRDEVLVYVSQESVDTVQADVLPKSEQILKQKNISLPEVSVKPFSEHPRSLRPNVSGIIVASVDGRVEFDNTIRARLERMENQLRTVAFEPVNTGRREAPPL